MNYYATQQILCHICPACHKWLLEAPETWDPDEIREIMAEHVEPCAWSKWAVPPYYVK